MAFSHDKLTFLILCFIIPQLIIVQAQIRAGNRCKNERDCLNGQICHGRLGRCYDHGDYEYSGEKIHTFQPPKEQCDRDIGKFLLF